MLMQIAGCGLQFRLQAGGPETELPQPGLRHALHTPKTRNRIASNPQPPPAPWNHRQFRYRFDSNQARQTVRWSRFRGLLFASVFAAEPGCELRTADCGLRTAGCGIRGCGIQGCGLRISGFKQP